MSREPEECVIVADLSKRMLEKLAVNRDKKRHWREESVWFLLTRAHDELLELEEALATGTNVEEECADVANMVAMIAANWKEGQRA